MFVLLRSMVFILLGIQLSGCSTWRGLPSHGGGKRFDEEQRVVAAAIRQAVANMNLEELSGTKIVVNIDSIGQNGGGTLNLPGLNSASGNYSDLRTTTIDRDTQVREGWGVAANIATTPDLKPTVFASEADIKYFEAALNMKLRHSGISFVPKTPDYLLYVLVDVLGTNRNRDDRLLFWTDNLCSTCELTYYAVDAKTNQLLFRARRSSAQANYAESSALFLNAYDIRRTLQETSPAPMPVDGNDLSLLAPENNDGALTPEPNTPEPTSFAQTRKELQQKLHNADTQMQAGNLAAAERLINEVKAVDPEFPGLDSVYSRLQALRSQAGNSSENSSKN